MDQLAQELKKKFKGEVSTDEEIRKQHSHDASIFEVIPQMVVFPKNSEDIQVLVSFVAEKKKTNPELSMAVRSGGTCMSGGTLTDSISVDMKYFNHIGEFGQNSAVV